MEKMNFILILFVVVFSYLGCSKPEETYWNDAVKFHKDGKISEAISSYETVANKYPEGKYAIKAMFEIAKLYHSKQLKTLNDSESFVKAAYTYEQIFNDYPKSPEAPKALFMKAFIEANDLKDLHKAKLSYEKFIRLFPNNELISSVEQELKNLGKSPEEILNQSLQVKK
jgi:TolA-binding protein